MQLKIIYEEHKWLPNLLKGEKSDSVCNKTRINIVLHCIASHLVCIGWVRKTMFMLVTMPVFKSVTI